MDSIKKNRIIRMVVSSIGLLYILNMQLQVSFTPIYSILPLIVLVVLQVYFSQHIITYICGIVCGLIFLVPVLINFDFSANLIPIVFDSTVGLVLIGVYGYKMTAYMKKK